MTKILFISDGSIFNPILLSQGMPLLNYVGNEDFQAIVFSREEKNTADYKQRLNKLESQFQKVDFYHTYESLKSKRGMWIFQLLKDFKALNELVKSKNIKIIHSRSLFPAILGFFLKMLHRNIKLIYDNRGLRILEEIESGHWKKKSVKVLFLRYMEEAILKQSDFIIVVSEYFRTYLMKNYKNIILENRIRVIPNRCEIKPLSSIRENNKTLNEITGVYLGSAAVWQSVNEFIKLGKSARNVFKDIKFIILTYHTEKFQFLSTTAAEIGINISVKNLPHEEVFGELIKYNFGILIRRDNPINNVSSPLKFAEYLSAGLPILISEGVGDTEKIIEKYKIGVIIRENNYDVALRELQNLLNDPEIYRRCREVAEKEFDIQTSFNEYLNIYQSLSKK